VSGNGKFEELIVCSNEIAASTAQLVVSSRVKAERGSKKMADLSLASKDVSSATGNVVATVKSGSQMVEEQGSSRSVYGLSCHFLISLSFIVHNSTMKI